jgi:mRNA interferase MazF
MNRGDVVIVDLRPHDPNAKVRPALVVQNDRDNNRLTNTIVALFTGNVSRARQDTQLLIDENHADWEQSGLNKASVLNCINLFTTPQQNVTRTIGSLSAQTMQEVDECLKTALGIT